jgi:hypothetical protein
MLHERRYWEESDSGACNGMPKYNITNKLIRLTRMTIRRQKRGTISTKSSKLRAYADATVITVRSREKITDI